MPARAKLPPGEGKRVPLNMRTTRGLREKLEKAAAESGRSLAQEVENQLERSLLHDDYLTIMAPDQAGARFVQGVLSAKSIIDHVSGCSIFDDQETYEAFAASVVAILDHNKPPRRSLAKKSVFLNALTSLSDVDPKELAKASSIQTAREFGHLVGAVICRSGPLPLWGKMVATKVSKKRG